METVDKKRAAIRQLEEAVRLYFEERDACAIHTLAAAAHQLVHDLAVAAGSGSTLKWSEIRGKYSPKQWIKLLNAPANFLKHANEDPNESLHFDLGLAELLIVDAIRTLAADLNAEPTVGLHVFAMYFVYSRPGEFADAVRSMGVDELAKSAPGQLEKPFWLALLRKLESEVHL